MTTFSRQDDVQQAEFLGTDLHGARFVGADLSDAVMRGVDVHGLDIDDPQLCDGATVVMVNGVDVAGYVDAELDRRFPGRALRRATDPDGLRAAWVAVHQAWDATLARVASMPVGTIDSSVAGEWSFAQTLRHLIFATDVWLGRSILRSDRPFHRLGLPSDGVEEYGVDLAAFETGTPGYDEVLRVRADQVAKVTDFVRSVSPEALLAERPNPWNPARQKTVLSCLRVILDEEWEHLRYARRDLDALEAAGQE